MIMITNNDNITNITDIDIHIKMAQAAAAQVVPGIRHALATSAPAGCPAAGPRWPRQA